ncbi:MAG: S8 family serine peptidase, partial [Anaerolineae bacterium]
MRSLHQRSEVLRRVLARSAVALLALFGLVGRPVAALAQDDLLASPGGRYIVQLETPAGLATDLTALGVAVDAGLASDPAGVAGFVSARVSEVAGASIEARFERLYQGLVVRVVSSDVRVLDELREIPGVRAVYPDIEFSPALYEAVEVTGVDQVWASLGGSASAGADVRVAVIDSGIDIAHPMLLAPGWTYPAGYPVGWPAYTSPKVIAARAYFRPEDPPAIGEGTPLPGAAASVHGTHLSAVIAGMTVTESVNGETRSLTGVAPGARLMNYRVFYPSASDGYERAFAVEIIQAIEDAVSDGADILCLGWSDGGDQLSFASPVADALTAAIAQGVAVIAPAGNEGPGSGSASRLPGGIAEVLTVGAQGAPYGRALFGPAIVADTPLLPLKAVASVATGANPYACAPLPAGSLTGSAALIERGVCPFATKVYMVQQAGAALALIVNTTDVVTDMACSGDYCGPGIVTIPGAMLASVAGQQLLNWARLEGATSSIALSASGRVLTASPELVAPFSARGAAYGLALKPDLIAPGVAIVSAAPTAVPGANYVALSGTSVAAAHVAGAAAILLAGHPSWAQAEIKSAMMGTARVGSAGALDEPRHAMGVLDQGAGLLDLPRALAPSLLLEPASISLGSLAAGTAGQVQVLVRDVRSAGPPLTWTIAAAPAEGLSLSAPATVTSEAGTDATVMLSFSVTATAQGNLSTVITFTSGTESYRLPLWGAVQSPPAAASVLLVDNDLEFSGGGVDTLPSIMAALQRLGVSYAVWSSDALAGAAQTWPSADTLGGYRAIIWTLGEKRSPDGTFATSTPPTARDQQALMSYLDGGGRLLVMGQNVASATDVNPDPDLVWGRSTLYRYYLGAHWLQDNVFAPTSAPHETVAVTGLPGTLLQGVLLDLGALGSGAGNQHSIDELGTGGSPGGDDLVKAVAAASGDRMTGAGYVMLAKSDEPVLEQPAADIEYRV